MKPSYFHRYVSKKCIAESQRQFWFPEPEVEMISKSVQIFLKISVRDTMESAIEKLLDVANHEKIKWQPFRGPLRLGNLPFVNMFSGHGVQRPKGICSKVLTRFQVKREEKPHGCLENRVNGLLHSNKSASFVPGLYDKKNRPFHFSTSTSLTSPFSSHIAIIKVNEFLKSINAVLMGYGCADFFKFALSTDPGDADMLGKPQCGNSSFIGGYQIVRPEPFDQRHFCGMKKSVGGYRNLVPASGALVKLYRRYKAALLLTTGCALETLKSTDVFKGFDSFIFCLESFLPFYKKNGRNFDGKTFNVLTISCHWLKI